MKNILICCFAGLIIACLISGCDPTAKLQREEQEKIDAYLNSLDDSIPELKPSGLYYLEIVIGTGRSPVVRDTAYFRFRCDLLDGGTISTNESDTVPPYKCVIGSGDIIPGIDEGLRYMREGGKSLMLTPSSLAHGAAGVDLLIPGFTPLLWIIKLDSVKAGPGK